LLIQGYEISAQKKIIAKSFVFACLSQAPRGSINGYRMTLDQIIGAITGVATLMAALGAMAAARGTFLSVEKVRKQTEASYRPQLSIAQAYVSCRNGTLLPLGSEYVKYPIPNSWTRSIGPVGKVSVPKRTLERFKLTVHNVGLGAALKVSVRWDCPLDQIINRIADLAEKMKHSSEKTEASEKIFSELERELGMLRLACTRFG
jgi:hypothetical protein